MTDDETLDALFGKKAAVRLETRHVPLIAIRAELSRFGLLPGRHLGYVVDGFKQIEPESAVSMATDKIALNAVSAAYQYMMLGEDGLDAIAEVMVLYTESCNPTTPDGWRVATHAITSYIETSGRVPRGILDRVMETPVPDDCHEKLRLAIAMASMRAGASEGAPAARAINRSALTAI